MPDITMCTNKTCPLHESCYRFKATPSEVYQSYQRFEPIIEPLYVLGDLVKCEFYIEIKE